MGMAAILVMWPRSFDQTFIFPSQWGSMWNLTLTGPVISEEKPFGWRWRRRRTEACLSYKLTDEPLGWAKNGMYITTSIFHIMYQGEWGTFDAMNKKKKKKKKKRKNLQHWKAKLFKKYMIKCLMVLMRFYTKISVEVSKHQQVTCLD